MSLKPDPIGAVPAETARVAQAAFPAGNPYLRLRETVGSVFTDADFADLYAVRGQPASPPWRLALVLILQFAEGLSDRQAADAMRARIDWKYLLGLELTDAGLDASVLCEFRRRLVEHDASERLLDRLVATCQAAGVVRERGQVRTDATRVLASVAGLNRLELVGETLRAALNALAGSAPDWARSWLDPRWGERYGVRMISARLPRSPQSQQERAEQTGRDGHAVLALLDAAASPAMLRALPQVAVLRRVWIEQFWHDQQGRVRWRDPADLPPAGQRIQSPYDVEVRYGAKGTVCWVGLKVHLTETCEPDLPRLVVAVTTTTAASADSQVLGAIHTALERRALTPARHLVDSGYVSADTLVASQARGIELLGPALADRSWQARAGQGFAAADFTLDVVGRQARCPQGALSRRWSTTTDGRGQAVIEIDFAAADCGPCAVRAQCTRSATAPRSLKVRAAESYTALDAARLRQEEPAFQADYAVRAGVEGTISQAVRRCGVRRTRYRGLAKSALEHHLIGCALTLQRLDDWWADKPWARTRTDRFVQVLAAA